MPYSVFCQSVIGQSHIEHGTQKEDAGFKSVSEDGKIKIVVLGDGHGDTNCPRASYGSVAVCAVAAEKLHIFAGNIIENNLSSELLDDKTQGELVRKLIFSIKAEWDEKVRDELKNNPLSEEERAQIAPDWLASYDKGIQTEHIYGTTLIAAVMTDGWILFLHQGDGQCVVFDKFGVPDKPVPWDERCFTNITTSVCDTDAAFACRYLVINKKHNPILGFFIGSDGVEDSVGDDEGLYTYYKSLLVDLFRAANIPEFENDLEFKLSDLNRKGSRDDTTVCGMVDIERIAEFEKKFEYEKQIYDCSVIIADYQSRLGQKNEMHKHLKDKYEKALAEWNSVKEDKKKYEDNADLNQFIEEELSGQRNEPEKITLFQKVKNVLISAINTNKPTRSKNDIDRIEQNYLDAKQEWEQYDATYQSIVAKLEEEKRNQVRIEHNFNKT